MWKSCYPDQKTSVRFFCSSKSGSLSWLSAKASFQGRDLSVPYWSNLLKFTIKFRIAFSKQAKKTAESELSISLAFTESPAHSQPWTKPGGRYKRRRQNLCLCFACYSVGETKLKSLNKSKQITKQPASNCIIIWVKWHRYMQRGHRGKKSEQNTSVGLVRKDMLPNSSVAFMFLSLASMGSNTG